MKNFSGKNVIVTGGGSGIGKALALAFVKKGSNVAITDIKPDRVEKTVNLLSEYGKKTLGFVVDHSDPDMTLGFYKELSRNWTTPDIMCLNAGIAIASPIEKMKIEEWHSILATNFLGVVYMLHYFLPEMIKKQKGDILITSSAAGLTALPGLSAYSSTKFALIGLSESIRMELSKYNINVSVLCPGVIDTGIVSDSIIHHKDKKGENLKPKAVDFYKTKGISPDKVAAKALKGLKKGQGIILSPDSHVMPPYFLKRIWPGLYTGLGSLVWKKGWMI